MTMRTFAVIAALTFGVLAFPFIAGLPARTESGKTITVEQVLQRYIEAVGGREAIAKLTTRVCNIREVTNLPTWDPPVFDTSDFETYTKSPNRFLMVSHSAEGIEKRGFDGEITWIQNKDSVRQDDEAIRLKLAWLLNPQNALHIREYFPELVLDTTDKTAGQNVYALQPANLDKAYYALHFDAKSGLLIRIGYYWDLRDYRKVDGVLFPHRIEMSRKGGSTTYEFIEVRHNVPLDDSLFVMPTAGQ
jgi:outer membrane lipoprotein-sorting protein